MSLRVIRFGTVVTTNKAFHDAEFTDLTCTVLAVKVGNPQYDEDDLSNEKEYLTKLTPTNPKFAADIMEYVQAYSDDPNCKEEWDPEWTMPQVKNMEK